MNNEINVNQDMVVFPSAQRNQTTASPNIDNPYAQGVIVYLYVTEASGTGGLQIAVYGVDPASSLPLFLQEAPTSYITTTGATVLVLYPTTANEGQAFINGVLPRTFQIAVIHHDASNYTYSLGISLIR